MRGRIRGSGSKTRYEIFEGGRAGWVEVPKACFDVLFPDKPIISGADLNVSMGWKKPIESDALAIHPDQIPEAEAHAEKHGVPTQFIEDGRPIFTSREHRRKYMRSVGVHDRRGGYSD